MHNCIALINEQSVEVNKSIKIWSRFNHLCFLNRLLRPQPVLFNHFLVPNILLTNKVDSWSVGVVQWVERSLQTPEIPGSNPVIGSLIYSQLYLQLYLRHEIKRKKTPGMAHIYQSVP